MEMILKGILPILLLSAWTLAQNPVRVEAFDEQGNNPGRLTLRLRLTNSSADTMQNVRARYFLPFEKNRSLQLSPHYLAGSVLSMDTVGGFLAVNVDLPKLAPGVFPNESGISLGMHYADYGDFEKGENFSYPGADSFAATDRIPVYLDGVLLDGESPLDGDEPGIRFSGFQPEKSRTGQWVKLENVGEGTVDLQLEAGSAVEFIQKGHKSILHTMNQVIWRCQISPVILSNYYRDSRNVSIAQGFKLIHHGNNPLFIEGEWAGTIFAPKARLVLGQAKKEIYGRFVGNGITVHQYATLHAVPFAPVAGTAVAYFNTEER